MARHVSCLLVVAALVAVSAPARAGDQVAAEAAFQDGRAQMKAGHYAAACAKFALSERLDPEVGTLLNLGVCHEKLGKLATAWAELNDAGDRASRAGEKRRARRIRALAHKLALRLSRLLVTVAGSRPPGLRVTRNGKDITLLVGTAVPVDPGTYTIKASAHGYRPWTRHVTVADKGATLKVTVPALAKAALPARAAHTHAEHAGSAAGKARSSAAGAKQSAPAGGQAAPAGGQAAPGAQHLGTAAGVSRGEATRDPGRVRRHTGIGLVIGGAASVAVGLGFGALAMAKNNDYKNACPDLMCPDHSGVDLHDQAVLRADLADAFVGVGLAAAVVGAYLWRTAPAPSDEGAAVSVAPVVTPSLAGAAVSGRF